MRPPRALWLLTAMFQTARPLRTFETGCRFRRRGLVAGGTEFDNGCGGDDDGTTEPRVVAGERSRREMGVAHRHLHALVAEDALELEDVAAMGDPMRGEGVPQIMKRHVPHLPALPLD